jgi:hypothetical protein
MRRSAIVLLLLLAVSGAAAQTGRTRQPRPPAFGQRFRLPEGPSVAPRYPPQDFEDGTFMICKMQYTSVRYEPMGVGWSTDYPYAGINLMIRMSELTRTPITRGDNGDPNYWVVHLTDDELFRCPFLMGSDVGTIGFSEIEARRLRDYLLKGGFLWVDDFWGTRSWVQWSNEIHKVLPEFPITEVPADHPIRHMMFPVDDVLQVTNIQNWLRTGNTSEQGEDSLTVDFRAISDEKGRILVVMTHNTDIGDSWEREGENHEFFEAFSPRGYALGINVLLYSLTH